MSTTELESLVHKCFIAGLFNVQPNRLLRRWLTREGNSLCIDNEKYTLGDTYIVGFGKAVAAMALEVETLLRKDGGGTFLRRGIVSVPPKFTQDLKDLEILSHSKILFLEGATENVPDACAHDNAKRIAELVKSLTENDLLIVLISGGGSALLCMPSEPLTLRDKIKIITQMSLSGASIEELNTVRIALSAIKGGRLALMTKARVASFILSDIIGNNLEMIASGPTVLTKESKKEPPTDILRRFKIPLTDDITTALNRQPPKVTSSDVKRVKNIRIGDNKMALEGVRRCVERFSDAKALILSSSLAGNAAATGEELSILAFSILRHLSNISQDVVIPENLQKYLQKLQMEELRNILKRKASIVLLFGGETTVEVTGHGKGGRNQEMILSASIQLERLSKKEKSSPPGEIVILSGGTDGIDGPTDAAGAYTFFEHKNGTTKLQATEARMQGLNPEEFLKNNNSFDYFSKFCNGKYLLKTGHTGTNVMDIQIVWIRPH